MTNIGIYYGSTTGNTETLAKRLANELQSLGHVELKNIAKDGLNGVTNYDLVLLGVSTWTSGGVQEPWDKFETLPGVDLSGKKVALFGIGDQATYPDTFADAIGIMADAVEKVGGTLVGLWSTEGYTFTTSEAKRGDHHFAGLVIDQENQANQTETRIKKWTSQLSTSL